MKVLSDIESEEIDSSLFQNVKARIIFHPYIKPRKNKPLSVGVLDYELEFILNEKYYLEEHENKYFIPYYIVPGKWGEDVEMVESYWVGHDERTRREVFEKIKLESKNKFIFTSPQYEVYEFYGYFDNKAKLNRIFNRILKPYLLDTFLNQERIDSPNLRKTIENYRFL